MKALILAAGRGRRLETVLPGQPKCLLTFGSRSLLQHQVAALQGIGCRECVVVVGYRHEMIREHLKGCGSTITYIENPIFDRTNTIYSLWLAREHFGDDFVYFNADVLFDYRVLSRLVAGRTSNLACVKGRCGEEEVKVVVSDGRISRIGKQLTPSECYGEFIGIARFAREDNARFAAVLDECIADEGNWNRFFEYAVDRLAQERRLAAVDISDLPSTEIDFPEDLVRARSEVFPRLNIPS
jgi:choline kinase